MTAKDRYRAGHTDLVYWLRSRGETLKKSGTEWEWKYQDERVTVRGNVWFDQYTQEGGDAVKFLQYFYGMSEEQAVAEHLGCTIIELDDIPQHLRPARRVSSPTPSLCEIAHKDGLGEGYEQQAISTDRGDLYVSFWDSGIGYYIKDEEEMEEYLGHTGQQMGGMC